MFIFVRAHRYLTECYDELGTQYKVPIYCLSYPINIVKEDNGRDSPAEYSEPVDGGTEVSLKLRLSSSFTDTKLSVYSKDTIGQCKKKLQVNEQNKKKTLLFLNKIIHFQSIDRLKKMWTHAVNDGSTVASYLATKFRWKKHTFKPGTSSK